VSTHVETTNLEAAHHLLTRAFGPMRLHAAGDRHHLRMTRDDCGPVQLHRITAGMHLTAEVAPLGVWVFGQVLGGTLSHRAPTHDAARGPGDAYLVAQPGDPHRTVADGVDADFAIIEPALLTEVTDGTPRFTGYQPATERDRRLWADTYAYVRSTCDRAERIPPLVVGGIARLLAVTALAAFPSDVVRDPTIEDRRDAHPAALRRAIAVIDGNAHRDISAADIAAAARVTIRALQLAFRRHLDTNPMAYLRRVRLDHAHRDLTAADPATTTVRAVAGRWGFASHSRFTAHYRATYRTTPSHTLRGSPEDGRR
jgi:AraC-like DNA-binding protein